MNCPRCGRKHPGARRGSVVTAVCHMCAPVARPASNATAPAAKKPAAKKPAKPKKPR